jgi:hypothetical protein
VLLLGHDPFGRGSTIDETGTRPKQGFAALPGLCLLDADEVIKRLFHSISQDLKKKKFGLEILQSYSLLLQPGS